jgi:membrane-associated phospholipid phosphatase
MIRTCYVRPGARHTMHAVHRPVHAAVHWPVHVAAGTWRRLIKEVLLIATFAVIYEEIRDHLVQAGAAAASHGLLIVSAERELGLFRERAVQAAIIGSDTVTDAFNAYYGGTHFLIPILVLAWLWLRHPAHYARARTALAAITGLAFIVFWLFPVAPPRLLPVRFGIIDTLVAGSGHVESTLMSAAGDQYASMPSVHVAWAVWCALAVYPVARHWTVRALAIAYPLVTTLVVVATGNHFFLDVIAGALLACVTWVAVTRVGAWLSVRIATRRSHREPGRWRPVSARPASVGAPDGPSATPEPGGPVEGDQVAA